jgi:hypothetical protein
MLPLRPVRCVLCSLQIAAVALQNLQVAIIAGLMESSLQQVNFAKNELALDTLSRS